MKWYLAILPLVVGLALASPVAASSNWWIHPYSDARGISECRNCPDGGNVVVARSVPSWSMTDKGVEYRTNYIIGSATTKTIQQVFVGSSFERGQAHPCAAVGACTMSLCLENVGCADVTSSFVGAGDNASAGTTQFAGTKWWGGDLWFTLYYQVHGSGPMIPARTTGEEALAIWYTDG
jgi:hypothetical protein